MPFSGVKVCGVYIAPTKNNAILSETARGVFKTVKHLGYLT
jgi:hypothetical protein